MDTNNISLEGKKAIYSEGVSNKKQENNTTKQLATRKIHANEIHIKLIHPGEDRMCTTANHLYYRIKGVLEVCEGCATAKTKQKFLQKVVEERNLKPGEIIYIGISSQKKPSYGGSKNCVLIQDADKKWYLFTKTKEYLYEKVTPFFKKINNMKENFKTILCDNVG